MLAPFKSLDLVFKELKKLSDRALGVKQLRAAKEQLLGQLAMAEENNINYMTMMARSTLDRGRVIAIEETYEKIAKTTSGTLLDLAREMFDDSHFSVLKMEPNSNGHS